MNQGFGFGSGGAGTGAVSRMNRSSAAAIIAALEQFMRETAPTPVPADPKPNPWFMQGLRDAVDRSPSPFG